MPIDPLHDAALVIIGHGSTENPDSSTPYFDHADEIRGRGIFAEVHVCFWKEEPSMREILYAVEAKEVYLVPDFISEGYFTRDVIPRELELDGPITQRGDQTLYYCDPVGIHPSMTGLILQRTKEVAPDLDPSAATLFIVGHGTGLNKNSTKAIRDQVELIRTMPENRFAAVEDTYMEEPPFIADWAKIAQTPNAVVVPFFIADGLHSYQDIPVMLGFEKDEGQAASQKEIFRQNPYHIREKTLYYSAAIGTEPMMADVILDQVESFRETHPTTAAHA